MQRGLLSTCSAPAADGATVDDLAVALHKAYDDEPFIDVVPEPPQTRWVVGSNRCLMSVHLDTHSNRAIVSSAIDNLLKGAAGQAVQCANLMLGLDETRGSTSGRVDAVSVAVPRGFQAAGVAAGIKGGGVLDVALLAAEPGTVGAAVFTVNSAAAAPVLLSRRHIAATDQVRAVVLNSGSANAATGEVGHLAAASTANHVAATLGCNAEQVLVCSTGTIGSELPVPLMLAGVDHAAAELRPAPMPALVRRRRS